MKKIFTLFAALAMVMSMSAATKTIYCKMAQSWWKTDGAAVGAYAWTEGGAKNANWPGVRMTPVTGETDLWSVDIDTDKYQKIIFTRVNGSGTVSDWGAKTADLTVPTDDKNLYTITSTNPVWGDPGVTGNWSVYAPDAPKTYKDITITIVANATPKIHYWEGGDKMVGTDWDNLPEMTATGEANTYSCTIKDVDEATGVKYLVIVGGIQSADQLAFENVNKNFKELLPQVAVMGVISWDGDKMTVADDYLSASVTLTLEAAKDYELKLTVNGEWFGSNAITITKDNNSALFAENGEANAKLITDLAGDYVFTYTYATKTLMVTYPEPVVEEEIYYEPYVLDNLEFTDNGDFYVLYATISDYNLELTFGVNAADGTLMDASTIVFGGELLPIVSSEPVTVEFNEEVQTNVYTVRVVVEMRDGKAGFEFIMYTAADSGDSTEPVTIAVVGATASVSNDGWLVINGTWNELPFVLKVAGYEDTPYKEYTGTQVGEMEFGEWGVTESDFGFADAVTVIKNGDNLDIMGIFESLSSGTTYNVSVSASFAAVDPETAVDNINASVAPAKMIVNGQLIIIRNGVKFNAAGAVVK